MTQRPSNDNAQLREILRRSDPARADDTMTALETARMRRAILDAGRRPSPARTSLPRWGWGLAALTAAAVLIVSGFEAARWLRAPAEPQVASESGARPPDRTTPGGSDSVGASGGDRTDYAGGAALPPPEGDARQEGGTKVSLAGSSPGPGRSSTGEGPERRTARAARAPSTSESVPANAAPGRHTPLGSRTLQAPAAQIAHSSTGKEPAGRETRTQPSGDSSPVTIQFTTERGTKIVWILDPKFDL